MHNTLAPVVKARDRVMLVVVDTPCMDLKSPAEVDTVSGPAESAAIHVRLALRLSSAGYQPLSWCRQPEISRGRSVSGWPM